jgi:hypothetical protein
MVVDDEKNATENTQLKVKSKITRKTKKAKITNSTKQYYM